MSGHDGLCNVTRYTDPQYTSHVPAPLVDPLVNVTEVLDDIYHGVNKDAILSLREQINRLHQRATNATAESPERLPDVAIDDDAVACRQQLVDAFLAEGMAEVNDGKPYSGYPIYGHKTAEARLEALRHVLGEVLQVDVQLPRSAPGEVTAAGRTPRMEVESREQYWRRLARLYIQKGQDIAAQAAAVCGAAPYEPEDPFYVIDLGRVVEQMALWRHCLPMVRPHFAVKCNPTLPIMQVLAALGAGFDCASKAEIDLVLHNELVDSPSDIIFANPCKQPGDIKAANAAGVFYTTFDNEAELEKLSKFMPNARAVLRIATNDSSAKCAFSTKFGARLDKVPALLARAAALHVDIYGVSFHVGSGNSDPAAYVAAIEAAHSVFEEAARHGFNCTLLDIGGGYPGTRRLSARTTTTTAGTEAEEAEEVSFEAIAAAIRPALERLFPTTTIISEPGRYFTAATHAVAMNVFAKRTLRLSPPERAAFVSQHAAVSARLEAEDASSCKDEHGIPTVAGRKDYDDDEGADDHRNKTEHRMVSWEEHQYYVNDGLYHSFNCIVFDHAHPRLWLLDDGDGADRDQPEQQVGAAENVVTCADLAVPNASTTAARPGKAPRIAVTTTTVASESESECECEANGAAAAAADEPAAPGLEADRDGGASEGQAEEESAFFSLRQSFVADSFAVRTAQWARDSDCAVLARRRDCPPRPLRVSTIFGPTCDSLDCILKQQPFPEMRVGDWLLAPDMGSYTTAAGCPFNGFATRRRELVCSVKLL